MGDAQGMLDTALEFRRNNAKLTARALDGDDSALAEAADLNTLALVAGLWPWIRLSEALELISAGYPIGHIQGLPPRDEWAHLVDTSPT